MEMYTYSARAVVLTTHVLLELGLFGALKLHTCNSYLTSSYFSTAYANFSVPNKPSTPLWFCEYFYSEKFRTRTMTYTDTKYHCTFSLYF